MSAPVIVKVQRPVSENGNDWLVYGQGRKGMMFLDADKVPFHVVAQMGDDFKAYFFADASMGAGETVTGWTIRNRTEEQSW